MVRDIEYSMLLLVCYSVLSKSYVPCLTWDLLDERLKFICRVPDLSNQICLIDSRGQMYANCTFHVHGHSCTPAERNKFIVPHVDLKYVVFIIEKVHKNMDGIWVCVHNNRRLTTHVSLKKGIIGSTEMRIIGELNKDKDNTNSIITRCFSCREPHGNNVEFLENKRSVDSLTFNSDTGKCTHHKGACQPSECSCIGNEFMRTFQYDTARNGTSYSCEMLFTDSFKHERFLILSSVFFNGKEFYTMNTSTMIVKAGNKIWNGTLSTDIEITTALNQPRTTTITETTDNTMLMTTGSLTYMHVIAIIIGSILLFMFSLLLVRQRFQRKPSNKKVSLDLTSYTQVRNQMREDTECVLLKDLTSYTQVRNQMREDTECNLDETSADILHSDSKPMSDNKIESATMTEESYLLQERSVFKREYSSNVCYLDTCDPCSFQYKERIAVFYCIDCEESLCANCSNYHKVMKQTRNHNSISMNKIPRNFSMPLTCTDHETMKHEYYCVDHECLCCVRCIATGHGGKGCKLEQIDDASKGFTKTQVYMDYDSQLNRYIDLLVDLNAYQYHIIDQMTNTITSTLTKSLFDKNKDHCKATEVVIQPITDLDDIKLRLNAFAKETCCILYSAGEQKGLFDFMKDNGSDRQLFILTHSLRQKLIEIDKRVSELVGHTKNAISFDKQREEVHTATFSTIERELTRITFHRWRQSQTAVIDPELK